MTYAKKVTQNTAEYIMRMKRIGEMSKETRGKDISRCCRSEKLRFAEPRLARAAERREEGMLRAKGTGQVLQARHYVYHTKRPRNASPQNRMSRAEN